MATPSSTLAWRTPWTEEPGGLQSMGPPGPDTTERLHFHFRVGEGTLGRGSSAASLRQPSASEEGGDDGGPCSLLRESGAFPQRREEQGTGWALHGARMGQGQAAGGAE